MPQYIFLENEEDLSYQVLVRKCSHRSPQIYPAVGTHKGAVTVGDRLAVSYKVKHLHHMTQQSFPGCLPKSKENTCPQKDLHAIVNYILFCDRLIHNGTKLGRTQRCWLTYWWIDKQTEAYPSNGILLGGKGKPTLEPRNMDRSQKLSLCYVKEARHKGLHAVRYNPLTWNSSKGETIVTEAEQCWPAATRGEGGWLQRTTGECFGWWKCSRSRLLWRSHNCIQVSPHHTVHLKGVNLKYMKYTSNKLTYSYGKTFPKGMEKFSWKARSVASLLLQSNRAELVPQHVMFEKP